MSQLVVNKQGLSMEPRISLITLAVADLPRSVEFYRDGLGLPLVDENTESIALGLIYPTTQSVCQAQSCTPVP